MKEKTLRELVTADFRSADVFRRYGLNYCCSAHLPLSTVCANENLELNVLLNEIGVATGAISGSTVPDFSSRPPDFFAGYIINVYHKALAKAVPDLIADLDDYLNRHPRQKTEVTGLIGRFSRIACLITWENSRVERDVFPLIRQAHTRSAQTNLLRGLAGSALAIGNLLEELKMITAQFVQPEKTCTRFSVLIKKMKQVQSTLEEQEQLKSVYLSPKRISARPPYSRTMKSPLILAENPAMLFNVQHITSLFENATEGMVVTDRDGKIILVNPSACRMFGYMDEELPGREIEMLIPAGKRSSHVQLREGFYRDPQNRVMGHGRDLHGERKDGFTFPVEVSLSTYEQDGGRYVIAFIVDITARKAIEEDMLRQREQLEKVTVEMRMLNNELENKVSQRTAILKEALHNLENSQTELHAALDKERQLNEIKSRFVSMASHEFRTPLSTVMSSASLAEKYTSAEDQDKRSRHHEKIKASVRHLNAMLDDFLNLGRLEGGKVTLNLQTFPVREVTEEVIAESSESARRNVSVSYRQVEPVLVHSDRNLYRHILLNLLSNAIKFSEDDGRIDVVTGMEDNNLIVEITDHGIGIPPEDQAHLFSSFFRGSNAVNIQGTGLGLHIVKRYLDMLNGNIDLISNPGNGTRVRFSIPVNTHEND